MIEMKYSNRVILEIIKFIVNSFKALLSKKKVDKSADDLEHNEEDLTKKDR